MSHMLCKIISTNANFTPNFFLDYQERKVTTGNVLDRLMAGIYQTGDSDSETEDYGINLEKSFNAEFIPKKKTESYKQEEKNEGVSISDESVIEKPVDSSNLEKTIKELLSFYFCIN